MNKKYDCTDDVKEHQRKVKWWMDDFISVLKGKAEEHDRSKLQEPEKSIFDIYTPKLKEMEFGSDEYKAALKEMGEGLKHHYEYNNHHPEYYKTWRCPICETVFRDEEVKVSTVLEGEKRFCPNCCKHGTIMEAILEPESGIYGMRLYDLVEMFCDWLAAAQAKESPIDMDYLRKRFNISPQLEMIFMNTLQDIDITIVSNNIPMTTFTKVKE